MRDCCETRCCCRAAQLAEEHAAQLRARLCEVEAELQHLRDTCAASERAAQRRGEADAQRRRDDAQGAERALAEARAALRAEERRVQGQLAALSHAHVAELTQRQAACDEAVAAARAAEQRLAGAVVEAMQAADQVAADITGMDAHLFEVRSAACSGFAGFTQGS